MILSVSQRCDIPAYFSEWFYNRIQAGFADVPTPFDPMLVHRVSITPKEVDLIVFMTKNPLPMLERLDELNAYNCHFQVTVTPYHHDIEVNVADKRKVLEAIRELSKRYGSKGVVVRYDPILLNTRYTKEFHFKAFERLCSQLSGVIDTVIYSFVDEYKNTRAHHKELQLEVITETMMFEISAQLAQIASRYGIHLQTCGEVFDGHALGIDKGSCISHQLLMKYGITTHYPLAKTRGEGCDCLAYTDLGVYNCCAAGCRYCYANYDESQIMTHIKNHDPQSTMLIGTLTDQHRLVIKKQKVKQTVLF